jgi:hypothetical protein
MAMESAFRPKCASAKTKQRFSGVIWEMQLPQLLLMNGTILEIQNLSIQSDAAQNPKMISDRNSQDIYSDPGSFETIKIRMANKFLLLKTTTFLLGDGFTKTDNFIDEFSLKTNKQKTVYLYL